MGAADLISPALCLVDIFAVDLASESNRSFPYWFECFQSETDYTVTALCVFQINFAQLDSDEI